MTDKILLSSLIVGLTLCVGLSFYLGRLYERSAWHKQLPPAMDKLCQDCYAEGVSNCPAPPVVTNY